MYCVDINFDEASKAWMRNKKKLGNGVYSYICGTKKRTKSGYCRNDPFNVTRRKKLMKLPGSEYYLGGTRRQVFGLEWEPCLVHKKLTVIQDFWYTHIDCTESLISFDSKEALDANFITKHLKK